MASKPTPETVDEESAEGAARPSYKPEGYKDADEFLAEARETYLADREADRHNFDAAEDDLRFTCAGIDGNGQWDSGELNRRLGLEQPSITNNVLPQYVGQVVGDRRVNQVSIKVLPTEDTDVDVAEIRSDLIRNIWNQSRGERVEAQSFEHEVTCGIGNMRVELDWTGDDVFDRDIFVRGFANPLCVTWDYMSIDPTGRDADHCFVEDRMPRKLYDKLYPDIPVGDMGEQSGEWASDDSVKVVEYWQMVERDRTIALMTDGKVLDITDKAPEEFLHLLFRDEMGEPRVREVKCKYARMHLITGSAILKEAYELKINRLPIIRCSGREGLDGDKRVRYGLIRFIKQNQRMANFWDSTKVELLSKAPRQQWIGPADAFQGFEKAFREAHITGDPIIKYNSKASAPPTAMSPVQYPAAFAQESAVNKQQMKDGTGLHDASLGIKSNETSGIAIQRRQHEGDVATVIYHDNMNAAVQEAGDIINQLIPQVYDVARTIRVVGADQEERLVRINDPMNKDSVDLAKGKYDVTISTGPAYQTRRQEASTSMMEAIRVFPPLMEIAGDLVAKAQDWPGADEMAERIRKKMIQAGTLEDDNDEMGEDGQPDPAKQAAMQQQQQAMQMQQMQMQAAQIQMQSEVAKAQAEARQAEANAVKAEADAQKAQIEAQRAEAEMHIGIGRGLNELSDVGQSDPASKPQPGNASQKRNSARPRRK
jgi:hypothetical protein